MSHKWAVFFTMMVGLALLMLGIVAALAHQNYDDPANWVNWDCFWSLCGGVIVVFGVVAILVKVFKS